MEYMEGGMHSFEKLRASELYCPKCRTMRSVREKLLLILPDGEISVYRCSVCDEELATRQEKGNKMLNSVDSRLGL